MSVLEMESTSTTPTAAASSTFATVLDILFSLKKDKRVQIDIDTTQALCLTCKAVRDVVDTHVRFFRNIVPATFISDLTPSDLHSLSPWRWPNITKIEIGAFNQSHTTFQQTYIDYFVTLPLLKLEYLSLECASVLPLAQSNWPMLQTLILNVYAGIGNLDVVYPPDLQFPEWPLKRLHLSINDFCQGKSGPRHIAFFGPFLKACPELIKMTIYSYRDLIVEVATMIASAPLPKLADLDIEKSAGLDFYEALFDGSWPALKRISTKNKDCSLLPLLASKSWVTDLEDLNINVKSLAVEQLEDFLQAIQFGSMESLSLEYLSISNYNAFRGVQLNRLNRLLLFTCFDMGDDDDIRDASDSLNFIFDTCCFPKIEILVIEDQNGGYNAPFNRGEWSRPPSKEVIRSFPLLKDLTLNGLDISRDVADYLGRFRGQTGCKFEVDSDYNKCEIEEVPLSLILSPHRIHLLTTLGLDWEMWNRFSLDTTEDFEFHNDCVY